MKSVRNTSIWNERLIIIALAVLSLWSVRTIFVPQCIWVSHDLLFNMERYAAAFHCMEDGQLAARWSRDINFGYGYPLLLFYPPLSVFFVAGLHFTGISIVTGTKLLAALSSVFAGFFTFRLGKEIWKQPMKAAFAAACYILLPYRLLTLMVRGAMAEYAAQALLPVVFLAFLRLSKTQSLSEYLKAALFSAILMLTHNVSWLMVIPVCIVLTIFSGKDALKSSVTAILATIGGLGLSAWYWLPAFIEKSLVTIGNLQVANHLTFRHHYAGIEKIFSEKWAYDGLGITLSILWVLALIRIIRLSILQKNMRHPQFFFVSLVPVIIIFTTPLASVVWENVTILQYIQFPWRFTAIAGLCATIVAPAALDGCRRPIARIALATLAIIAMMAVSGLQTDRPITRFDENAGLSRRHLRTSGTTTVVADEYLPRNVLVRPETLAGPRREIASLTYPCAVAVPENDQSGRISAYIISREPQSVVINCLFFPGWIASLDGQEHPIFPHPDTGLIMMDVPAGNHFVDIRFTNTLIRSIGMYISGLSCFLFICMLTLAFRKRSKGITTPDDYRSPEIGP